MQAVTQVFFYDNVKFNDDYEGSFNQNQFLGSISYHFYSINSYCSR